MLFFAEEMHPQSYRLLCLKHVDLALDRCLLVQWAAKPRAKTAGNEVLAPSSVVLRPTFARNAFLYSNVSSALIPHLLFWLLLLVLDVAHIIRPCTTSTD